MHIVNIPNDYPDFFAKCPQCTEALRALFDLLVTRSPGMDEKSFVVKGFTVIFRAGFQLVKEQCGLNATVVQSGRIIDVIDLTCEH